MKKLPASIIFVIFLIVFIPYPATGQRVVEEIVAIVNEDIITLSEYKHQFDLAVQQLRAQQISSEDYAKAYKMIQQQLLDSMITDLLLLQQAKEKNINVKDHLKSIIENIKKENNLASDEDLKRALAQQGMPYELWVKQYEDMLLKQAVVFSEIEKSIVLSDSEIINYYKQNRAEFTVPTEYTLKAVYLSELNWRGEYLENRKIEISQRIERGDKIEDVAADLSDPPLHDLKGELGTLSESELDPDLREAVKKLSPGKISPWVKAKGGWYVLKLDDKKDSYVKTFEDARKEIEEKLYSERHAARTEEFIKKLRQRSYIKILKPDPYNDF